MKALAQEAEAISIGLSDFFGHPESEWDYYKKDNPDHIATNGTVIHTRGKDIFVYNKGTCDICECDFSETFFPDCGCYATTKRRKFIGEVQKTKLEIKELRRWTKYQRC
jgi:hypothetical protein